ncbi:hypothetical protein [Kitasatospora terrestris]|uniref:hypothetical protein n=1 Tax=Kitasatospora terrestris TaxID=258051 RepID=UPI0031ED41C1
MLVAVRWIETGAAAAGPDAVRLPAPLLLLDLPACTLPLLTGACLARLRRILREGLRPASPPPAGAAELSRGRLGAGVPAGAEPLRMRTGPSPGNLDTWPTIN